MSIELMSAVYESRRTGQIVTVYVEDLESAYEQFVWGKGSEVATPVWEYDHVDSTDAEGRPMREIWGWSDETPAGAHAWRVHLIERPEQETVRCECGEWTGEACAWKGPIDQTVRVEYMPRQHRASHAAAGNGGVYPHNGSVRVRVHPDCADLLLEDATEARWARIVE